jgi:hypothetical protein
MTRHPEVPVKVNAWVDKGVADLVSALSEVEGLVTLESCQGGDECGSAFVIFEYGNWRQTAEFLFDKVLPALSADLRSDTALRVEAFDVEIARGCIDTHPRAIPGLTAVIRGLLPVCARVPVARHAHRKAIPKIVSSASSD